MFFGIIFGGFIVLEVLLWGLLLAGASALFVSTPHSRFVEDILLALFVAGLAAIGAASYFVFRRMTRAEYVASESERWLAQRRKVDDRWIKRRRVLTRWAVWVPTIAVILICAVFDYAWAFGSHLFHPGYGRLSGFEITVPLTWTIALSWPPPAGVGGRTILLAQRYRGLLRAGSGLFVGRQPFSTSSMDFRTIPAGEPTAANAATKIISVRTLPLGKTTIDCREEVPPHRMTSGRYIRCSTRAGDFFAAFSGSDEDVAAFYRALASVSSTQ